MPRPAIEFRNVGKTFPARRAGEAAIEAVRDVNLTVYEGEVVSLIGPSGCGKSTLLNMGSGLYLPSSGDVRVAGQPVTGPNAHVAFMLQKDLLLPWRTIRENAELGLEIRGVPPAQRREKAAALLAKCHLARLRDRTTRTSSPAACASARRSRARSPSIRWCCSSTSRSRRSMRRPR